MQVQTVLGAIGQEALGRTLMHEHLFVCFPGAEFDPGAYIDRPDIVKEAVRKLRELRENHGVTTLVDPCPIELGRDVRLFAEISEKSGVNVVCTTGFYHEQLGIPTYWRARTTEEIAELFISEITQGITRTGIRAGAIKVSTGANVISPLERRFLDAACMAHRATGVPIITHTQVGTCGPEQVTAFVEGGVAPHQCLIGHCCGNPDHAYHRGVVDGGAYIGFDRIGYENLLPDAVRADRLVELVRAGYGAQIMMSHDTPCVFQGKMPFPLPAEAVARIEALRAKGMWPTPITHMFTEFFPMLRERGMSNTEINAILDQNPSRFFSGEALPIPGAKWPPAAAANV